MVVLLVLAACEPRSVHTERRVTDPPAPVPRTADPVVVPGANVVPGVAGQVACDDSSDCPHGRCVATAAEGAVTVVCLDERGTTALYPGDREVCTRGSCKTPGTQCRKGIACPFFGPLCEVLAVCDASPPACGDSRCSADAPVCCYVDGEPECAVECTLDPTASAPVRERWTCTSATDCGPEMDCCVSQMMGTSSFCSYLCDVQALTPVCDRDEDCNKRGYPSFTRCSTKRLAPAGVRVCE